MTKSNYNVPLRPSLFCPNLTVQHSSLLWLWRMEGMGRHNVRWWTSFAVICCRQKQKNATRVHATSSEFSFCFRRAAGCDWVGQNQGSCDSTLVVVKRSNYRCIHLHTGSAERMRKHYRERGGDGDAPVLSNHKMEMRCPIPDGQITELRRWNILETKTVEQSPSLWSNSQRAGKHIFILSTLRFSLMFSNWENTQPYNELTDLVNTLFSKVYFNSIFSFMPTSPNYFFPFRCISSTLSSNFWSTNAWRLALLLWLMCQHSHT